jgi:hypothetical protein
MPSLSELQRSFGAFLASPAGQRPDERLTGAVRAHGLETERRLAVYKNNVYARLIEALAATYPAVARLVGEDFFRFAAREYVVSHPATQRTLIGYGDGFADFLAAFEPAASVPYLPDVARLEHLYLEAYHAAEAEPLTRDRLEALVRDPSTERSVALHPSARLMSSRFPVSRIWEINVREEPIEGRVSIAGDAEHLLIIRPRATVEVRRLSRGAFVAVSAMRKGRGYAEALDAGSSADAVTDLHEHLLSLAAGESFVEKGTIP